MIKDCNIPLEHLDILDIVHSNDMNSGCDNDGKLDDVFSEPPIPGVDLTPIIEKKCESQIINANEKDEEGIVVTNNKVEITANDVKDEKNLLVWVIRLADLTAGRLWGLIIFVL